MTVNPYAVLGPTIPGLLGRASLLQQIDRHLLKASPDHVSVVGPAFYGKSVVLLHVADTYRARSRGYLTAVYVDLRRGAITSDADFKRRFAGDLKAALQQDRPDLAGNLDLEDESIHELLGLIFDELAAESSRVLVVLDGFDYVLRRADLTRNLWDQLRALAQRPSLRLVAASRRPLREICQTEESRTSDFWAIFNPTPVRVAALDDVDLKAFMQPLLDCGHTLDGSARKEIANWTGGVPLLVGALLRRLWETHHKTLSFSKPDVDEAAKAMLDEQRDLLAALWDDCGVELKEDLASLAGADVPRVDLSDRRVRAIEDRGFGRLAGNRLRGSCRLMQSYAEQQAPAVANLKRLFGTASGFDTNIRSLLELRLEQVATPRTDKALRDFVTHAVRYVDDNPEIAISGVRGIVTRALALIWEAELLPDRRIPSAWIDEWKHAGERLLDDPGTLPRGDGAQCRILRLVTGTERSPRLSTYVTKTTYLLVNHLQSVGDFGQHRNDYPETEVTVGFAASVVLAAISLVESLTADLHGEEKRST